MYYINCIQKNIPLRYSSEVRHKKDVSSKASEIGKSPIDFKVRWEEDTAPGESFPIFTMQKKCDGAMGFFTMHPQCWIRAVTPKYCRAMPQQKSANLRWFMLLWIPPCKIQELPHRWGPTGSVHPWFKTLSCANFSFAIGPYGFTFSIGLRYFWFEFSQFCCAESQEGIGGHQAAFFQFLAQLHLLSLSPRAISLADAAAASPISPGAQRWTFPALLLRDPWDLDRVEAEAAVLRIIPSPYC